MNKKENYLRAVFRQNPEWVPYSYEAVIKIHPPICERPKNIEGKDAFGVEWSYNPKAFGGTYPSERNFVISDLSKWREQVVFPDMDSFDWSEARKQAEAVDRQEYLVCAFVEMGIFERIYLLMGMEEALMAYYTDEEEMEQLASAIADYKIALLKRFYKEIKPDMIWYGDDWGTQTNLFISPDKWRRIIKPHTKRIYDCAKSLGLIVDQHSCGKIESVVGDLVEMGADCWNLSQTCNDLASLKQQYGDRLCFVGGMDSQFVFDNPYATVDDVVAEVKKRIDEMALPNGGFAISPNKLTAPPDKMEAMMRTIAEYGREVYQKRGTSN